LGPILPLSGFFDEKKKKKIIRKKELIRGFPLDPKKIKKKAGDQVL